MAILNTCEYQIITLLYTQFYWELLNQVKALYAYFHHDALSYCIQLRDY